MDHLFAVAAESQMKEFSRQTAERHKASLDRIFADHVDA